MKISVFSTFSDLNATTPQNYSVMALKQHIEWDPEEVAAGYDFSSIFEGLDENTTVPVISSVVNTTDLAGPAKNITAGFSNLLKELVEKVVTVTLNTTNHPSIHSTTMVPSSSSSPASISHLVKKAVEQLGKESHIPVVTVCIYIFYRITHSV